MTSPRTLALGLTATLALVTGGCGRGDEPEPTPSPPSPSVSPGFVVLSDVDDRILTDIRYATADNFVGRRVDGYREPLCLLTARAAEALRRVQDTAIAAGRSLKVYDCYRPQRATDDFLHWAGQPDQDLTKAAFYPRVPKAELIDRGYLGAPSSHSRGSTVDVTLVDLSAVEQAPSRPAQPMAACAARRHAGNSVDMGTGFDCFDPLSHIDAQGIAPAARENRRQLRQLMTDAGFVGYDREWWHFRYRDEPWPDAYFDLPVTRSSAG
ncbi:M15 family metallopeptidase [Verrucosispora sp. WMMC514]|uniref:M15 family metallopeptidase n=1 Tax=Verrucosispora sp. WMMC514 TaxID=3015156 RepID=UPI00248BFBA7|nr:M15 family metallopeptidase [Verrucosispora sp. WMMC514]WBB90905.1 M15 family metallopeptidase [Verrucosispora sp. WMMC514]